MQIPDVDDVFQVRSDVQQTQETCHGQTALFLPFKSRTLNILSPIVAMSSATGSNSGFPSGSVRGSGGGSGLVSSSSSGSLQRAAVDSSSSPPSSSGSTSRATILSGSLVSSSPSGSVTRDVTHSSDGSSSGRKPRHSSAGLTSSSSTGSIQRATPSLALFRHLRCRALFPELLPLRAVFRLQCQRLILVLHFPSRQHRPP
jgi:hypothetical protein